MPNEIRKIEFTNAELQAALVNYCLRHSIHLPDDFINHIDVGWENETTATFVFNDIEPGSKNIVLNKAEVAAALIQYCHANHMPLPHHAEKEMEVSGDSIALLIHFSWDDIK